MESEEQGDGMENGNGMREHLLRETRATKTRIETLISHSLQAKRDFPEKADLLEQQIAAYEVAAEAADEAIALLEGADDEG